MKTYCVSCKKKKKKKKTGNKSPKVIKTKSGSLQMESVCSVCGNKKVGLFQRKKDLTFYKVWELELH